MSHASNTEHETIERNLAAWKRLRDDLELDHCGEWVLLHDARLIGTWPSFAEATGEATERYAARNCLIRRVAEHAIQLGASVRYRIAPRDTARL